MSFVFYPKHQYGCPHVNHCPHLGGAAKGHAAKCGEAAAKGPAKGHPAKGQTCTFNVCLILRSSLASESTTCNALGRSVRRR